MTELTDEQKEIVQAEISKAIESLRAEALAEAKKILDNVSIEVLRNIVTANKSISETQRAHILAILTAQKPPDYLQ